MYRFRTINNLLDEYHELENQEIYFASPEELNDPMEGYKVVFWKGDKIVWENFIINYVKSVDHFFSLAVLYNEGKKIPDSEILVEPNRKIYGTPWHKNLIKDIIDVVLQHKVIRDLPDQLSQRTASIGHSELSTLLLSIHPFIISCIGEIYSKKGMVKSSFFSRKRNKYLELLTKNGHDARLINSLDFKKAKVKDPADYLFSVVGFMSQQLQLMALYQLSDKELSSNKSFLIYEFPERYVSKLEVSIYPNWYLASFVNDCSNSALWSHYGENHKGVCLKFKVNASLDKIEMNLDTVFGISGQPGKSFELKDLRPHEFKQIKYDNNHVEIDFFRSLARMNRTELLAYWYADSKGNVSTCYDHLDKSKSEDEWRHNYWEKYYQKLLIVVDTSDLGGLF